MVQLNVDFSGVKPALGGNLPIKEEGWYVGIVIETKEEGTRDTRETGNRMLICTIAYQDGSKHVERFNLWHQKDDTKRIAYENLAAMLQAMGLSGQQLQIGDTSQFHNLPFDHFLAVQESKTDQGKTIKQNRMVAVRNKDGSIVGNVPVAVAAPAAQTAAPAAAAPTVPAGPGPAAQPWGGGQAAAPAAGFPGPAGGPAAPQAGFPAPGAPAAGFPAPGGAPAGGFPAPATQPGGFAAPGAPAGGFAAPGGPAGGPWGGPQQ